MRGPLLAVVLLAALPVGLQARAYEVRTVGGWQRELRADVVVRTLRVPEQVFSRGAHPRRPVPEPRPGGLGGWRRAVGAVEPAFPPLTPYLRTNFRTRCAARLPVSAAPFM